MRDVEFSASRENIRSKGLMQRFLSTIPKRGFAEQTAMTVIKEFARIAPNPTEIPNPRRSDPFP